MPRKDAEDIAMDLLERVKIPEQPLKYPGQLSGGQQQRVAIARALHAPEDHAVRRADILDPEMIKEVLDTMIELARMA